MSQQEGTFAVGIVLRHCLSISQDYVVPKNCIATTYGTVQSSRWIRWIRDMNVGFHGQL